MVAETAESLTPVPERDALRLPRIATYVASAIAGVLALADCIVTEQFVNEAEMSSPRLDDQFNTTTTIAAPVAVVILVLLLGSLPTIIFIATRAAIAGFGKKWFRAGKSHKILARFRTDRTAEDDEIRVCCSGYIACYKILEHSRGQITARFSSTRQQVTRT